MTQDKERVAIVVNGREKEVPVAELSHNGEITFEQVIALAYDPVPSGPGIVFTMSFWNGAGRPHEGRLVAGQSVKIEDGTAFNVSYTDKS